MSALYPLFKQSLLTQSPAVVLSTDTIKCAAVDLTVDYGYVDTHQYKNQVQSYTGSTDATLSSKSYALGVFDAADISYVSLGQSASKTVGALVIYKDTGDPATSPLICYIDGFTAVTPNGGTINVSWNVNGIFAI